MAGAPPPRPKPPSSEPTTCARSPPGAALFASAAMPSATTHGPSHRPGTNPRSAPHSEKNACTPKGLAEASGTSPNHRVKVSPAAKTPSESESESESGAESESTSSSSSFPSGSAGEGRSSVSFLSSFVSGSERRLGVDRKCDQSLPKKCTPRALASNIWPLRSVHPHPASLVYVEFASGGNPRRYVTHVRAAKSSANDACASCLRPRRTRGEAESGRRLPGLRKSRTRRTAGSVATRLRRCLSRSAASRTRRRSSSDEDAAPAPGPAPSPSDIATRGTRTTASRANGRETRFGPTEARAPSRRGRAPRARAPGASADGRRPAKPVGDSRPREPTRRRLPGEGGGEREETRAN